MSRFEELVRGIVRKEVREKTLPSVVGYIPIKGVNRDVLGHPTGTCTVRYPNPQQGMDMGQMATERGPGSYLEAHGVPLPRSAGGSIDAVAAMVDRRECGVVLEFLGGNIEKPRIAQFIDEIYGSDGEDSTKARSNATVDQSKTAAPPAPPLPQHAPVEPPPPPNLPPSQAAKDKVLQQKIQLQQRFQQ